MQKYFVTYKQALALKELGFDESCLAYWNIDPQLKNPAFNMVKPFEHEWCLSAPLKSQVFEWFRENYGIFNPQRLIFESLVGKYGLQSHDEQDQVDGYFDTYEEAESPCIDKLIEIVKQKL